MDHSPSSSANIAIGVFDGVHRGHQALLQALAKYGKGTVITFSTHPRSLPLLCTLSHRMQLIEAFGHQALPVAFDEIKDKTAENFLDELVSNGLKYFVLGYDNHIGKGRAGTPDFIKCYLENRGVTVETVPPILEDGLPISSGRIRKLIEEGKMEEAEHLLGRPWSVLGNNPYEFSLHGLVTPPARTYHALLNGSITGTATLSKGHLHFDPKDITSLPPGPYTLHICSSRL